MLIVFAGPSLAGTGSAAPGVSLRPPARCGDVAAAVRERPAAIGLVDGLFETAPSPWHKELLWALSRGIAVYGAASMGAIRAAELLPFGMVGVGRVFELYRDGVIEDDDEVAVQHGPPELGYVHLSEAMVNVRATMAAAHRASIVGEDVRDAVVHAAKSLFYKDRRWDLILERSRRDGASAEQLGRLRAWLPGNVVDLKREDACALVARLAAAGARHSAPASPAFQSTAYWKALERRLAPPSATAASARRRSRAPLAANPQ